MHLEKGFLHTIWSYLVRPGKASMNFLKGRRRQYQSPVSYILILTGLYILIHNFIIGHYEFHYSSSSPTASAVDFREQSNIFLRTHFTPFLLLIILISAVVIYYILGRKKFNFIEILTLCLFGGGTYFMMLIVSDVVLGMIFKINVISMQVFLWQTSLSALYNLWFCIDIFKKMQVKLLWIRIPCVSILVSLIGWGIMNYLPLAWVSIFG